MDLEAALIDALRPAGLRERVRFRLIGGLTTKQIRDRLDPTVCAQLAGDVTNPVLASRLTLDRIEEALKALKDKGTLKWSRVKVRASLRGKGARFIWIDAYQLVD